MIKSLEQRLKKLEKKSGKTNQVIFRVSDQIFHALLLLSSEQGTTRYNITARGLVEKALRHSNEKTIKASMQNLHAGIQRVENKIDLLLLFFEYYMQSHYALHPEVPYDQRKQIAEKAEKRAEDFFKIVMSKDIKSGSHIIEKMIADRFEEVN